MNGKHEAWLDSIDYYALERAYRVLSAYTKMENISEALEIQFEEWFLMDVNTVEKGIALRMVFERERHRRVITDEEIDRLLMTSKHTYNKHPNIDNGIETERR